MQPAQNESEFPVGTLLDNRYEVISPLGRGACGVVYKVRQVLLNKEFALKSLSKDSVNDLSLVRFQREAQACFSLNHPSIIKVHDFGLTSDGLPFLVMELLNGETLTDRIGRTGPLPIEETVDIIIQACFGLAYAHENGVVHRDIKSSNIMLMKNLPVGREGSVKIVDLGIAKFTVQGDNQLTLTRTGEVFGSPLYMSPEQCGGLQTDQRTDIYSLGCVFFECLTGAPPFRAPDVLSTMIKHQTESTPSLKEASLGRNFPKGLELIISKMLAKDLGERYQNIAQVVADLGKFKRGEPLKATEGKTGAGIKNNKSIVGAGLAVAIVASILIVGFLSLSLGVLFLNFSKSPLKPQNESAPVEASVISQLFDTRFVKPLPPNELVKILQDAKLNGKLLLYGCHITVDDFKQIGACKNLTMIGMEQCELENDGFAALSKEILPEVVF
ncbi:MAG TPA: serine/threonine-protein kinase [Oculatellaceae cyanobacterium]